MPHTFKCTAAYIMYTHTQCMLKVTFFLLKYPNNYYLSFSYFCPIAKTKFRAPMRKNSTIGIMVEVERHHKTSGVILILKEKVSQSPLLLLSPPYPIYNTALCQFLKYFSSPLINASLSTHTPIIVTSIKNIRTDAILIKEQSKTKR